MLTLPLVLSCCPNSGPEVRSVSWLKSDTVLCSTVTVPLLCRPQSRMALHDERSRAGKGIAPTCALALFPTIICVAADVVWRAFQSFGEHESLAHCLMSADDIIFSASC